MCVCSSVGRCEVSSVHLFEWSHLEHLLNVYTAVDWKRVTVHLLYWNLLYTRMMHSAGEILELLQGEEDLPTLPSTMLAMSSVVVMNLGFLIFLQQIKIPSQYNTNCTVQSIYSVFTGECKLNLTWLVPRTCLYKSNCTEILAYEGM